MYDLRRATITARDAVRRHNLAETVQEKEKVVLDYLYLCNEIGEREGFEFGGARIKALEDAGCPAGTIIKLTRGHRTDPKLAPLLDHLKSALVTERKP